MQGRSGVDGVDAATARGYLLEGLEELGTHARQYNVPLIFEPLNRYETNMATTVEQGVVQDVTLERQLIKAVYANAALLTSPDGLQSLIDIANTTEINAIVIDVKEVDGRPVVLYVDVPAGQNVDLVDFSKVKVVPK